MGFRIGDSTNVVIACIVSSYGQMEIEMKKLWPSSLLLLQRNDISKVEKPVREYALHDWICQAEVWITNFCKYELFLVHLNPSKHHPLYSTPLYIFNFFASRDAPPPPYKSPPNIWCLWPHIFLYEGSCQTQYLSFEEVEGGVASSPTWNLETELYES